MVHRKPSGRLARIKVQTIFFFFLERRRRRPTGGQQVVRFYVPRVGAAVFERDGDFVPKLVLGGADTKNGEDARERDEEAEIDKVPRGTGPPTESEGQGQQRVVAESPVGVEEALGLEREGFWVGHGIMKHTPNDGQRDKRHEDVVVYAFTMAPRSLGRQHEFLGVNKQK